MTSERSSETLAHRRWLIGVAITLVFGIFGAVMAVLAYTKLEGPKATSGARRSGTATPPRKGSAETTPAATTTAPAPAPTAPSPAPAADHKPGHSSGHRPD